jgi:hypothetical protein
MIKRLFLTVLLLCLPNLVGCSFVPISYMLVDVNSNTTLPLIDPNNGPLKMTLESNTIAINTRPVIDLKETCKVKYNPLPFEECYIIVAGQLAKNYQCRVLIDTGYPLLGMLSYNIVQENKLPVYPIEETSPGGGVCYLPYLRIGRATIHDVACVYQNKQWELQLFSVPVIKPRVVLFGLQLMREFKHILFDGVHKELTLSAKQSFRPTQDSTWQQYPFKIEEDATKSLRLMVDFPIEGKNYHIALDTGDGAGLVVDTAFFDKLSKDIKVAAKKQNLKRAFYQYGWVDCRKVVLPELDFCHRKIKNVQIIIRLDDTAFKCPNFVGMQCFEDTVFVLDFERELLWVKD